MIRDLRMITAHAVSEPMMIRTIEKTTVLQRVERISERSSAPGFM